MTDAAPSPPRPTVLVYEPRVEGHHVSYLKFVTEALLSAGYPVELAIDTRPAARERIQSQMASALEQVRVRPLLADDGRRFGGEGIAGVAHALADSGAQRVFLDNFDDVASEILRRAAFGRLPPANLRGRLGGIYQRPRFLAGGKFSPNTWFKRAGFRRLLQGAWFSPLLLTDPALVRAAQTMQAHVPVRFMPDPYPENFVTDRPAARAALELPADKVVLLFYGGPYRRKGLSLALEAVARLPQGTPALLLCAGQILQEPAVAAALDALQRIGRARVIDRYVSAAEEKQLFAASDVALLPYLGHFGSSGVLARAAAAGLPVIASDEQLIGRWVREKRLGLVFRSGDALAMGAALERMLAAPAAEFAGWQRAARAFGDECSPAAFRRALLAAFAGTGGNS